MRGRDVAARLFGRRPRRGHGLDLADRAPGGVRAGGGTAPSALFDLLAQECEELDVVPVDDGGLFTPTDAGLAGELHALAHAAAQATRRAATAVGMPVRDFPAVSIVSVPATADGEPGLVHRLMSGCTAPYDPACRALARLDLPGALRGLAAELRALEAAGPGCGYATARHVIAAAQEVCSVLDVLSGLARRHPDQVRGQQ